MNRGGAALSSVPFAPSVEVVNAVSGHDSAGRCFHCGETLPLVPTRIEHTDVDGIAHAFCCGGCAAATRWIADAGLQDYYRLRQRDGARIDARIDTDTREPNDDDFSAWDREDVLAGHARTLADGTREITLLTDGMRCAACAWLIDRALCRDQGVREVVANAVTGRIRLVWDPRRTRLSVLLARLTRLGYRPALANGDAQEAAKRRQRRQWLIRWGIAGLGTMQAMMFAEALYLDTARQMPVPTRDFFRWIALLVSTPVVFYAGWPFLEGLWRELRARRLGMDTLIASSTLLAYFASAIETVRGGVHVWYDAAVMFVFLLLTARMLEARARAAASAQVDALARARPALAMRERADGGREQVPLQALAAGDIVRVAAGEAVPADGRVLVLTSHENARDQQAGERATSSAIAAFDESLLTGESRTVEKRAGETVYAGSVCRERTARLEVTRIGEDTRLSQLTRLVERAQAQRPALARQADRIAGWFVFALTLTAAGVYAWWHAHDPSRAFEVALAVLVVSCPCALSLAVPAALTTVHGTLAKLGVLALRPEALSALARADRIVFDKTGTLSDRRPRIATVEVFERAFGHAFDRTAESEIAPSGDTRGERDDDAGSMSVAQALKIACALERDSGHPLATAFEAALSAQTDAKTGIDPVESMHCADLRSELGHGIAGRIDGIDYLLGRADWAAREDPQTLAQDDDVWLGDGRRAFARFVIKETPRDDARTTVHALRELGLQVEVCSGDAPSRVSLLARMLGLGDDDAHARCTPEDKLGHVRAHQAAGEVVAMVGDGLNDAPVLAGADVSLALADGAALAQRAADFVIVGDALSKIPLAVTLARRSGRVMRESIAWAVSYNLCALPLAASGLVTPWMAAVGMALSSLLVTLNALRLTRVPVSVPPRVQVAQKMNAADSSPSPLAGEGLERGGKHHTPLTRPSAPFEQEVVP